MTPLSGKTALTTPGSARIVQLSDTHLMAESGGRLVGIDTDQSLAAVCRLIARQEPVDALLLTGIWPAMKVKRLTKDCAR